MTPEHWATATQELAERDKVMQKLISCFKGAALCSHGDAYTTLVRSIVGQQISVQAAESVWKKIITTVSEITPYAIHNTREDVLRGCGLSQRKVVYLHDLSIHFINKSLSEAKWQEMDDEALISELTQVKGIGRWTAEMFLIFHMLRLDVLPMNDLGLKRALSIHYNANHPISDLKIRTISELWKPWRSVATWYLWRSLDSLPVDY